MLFSVTYYLDLQNIFCTIDVIFYQVKLLMIYNVQTTNLPIFGKCEIYSK